MPPLPPFLATRLQMELLFDPWTEAATVAEIFVEFVDELEDGSGSRWKARACGRQREDGLWEGWVEFVPTDGGDPLRTGRESTQPNREDLRYWASGLTFGYLEGALRRAQAPRAPAHQINARMADAPAFEGPAERKRERAGAAAGGTEAAAGAGTEAAAGAGPGAAAATGAAAPTVGAGNGNARAVLNPFEVYREGDGVLRGQLGALDESQLRNIVRGYELSTRPPAELRGLTRAELVDLILREVEARGG